MLESPNNAHVMPEPPKVQNPFALPNVQRALQNGAGRQPMGGPQNSAAMLQQRMMQNMTPAQLAQFANQIQAQMLDANYRGNGGHGMMPILPAGMPPIMPRMGYSNVQMTAQNYSAEEVQKRQMDSLLDAVKEAPPLPETEPSKLLKTKSNHCFRRKSQDAHVFAPKDGHDILAGSRTAESIH